MLYSPVPAAVPVVFTIGNVRKGRKEYKKGFNFVTFGLVVIGEQGNGFVLGVKLLGKTSDLEVHLFSRKFPRYLGHYSQ